MVDSGHSNTALGITPRATTLGAPWRPLEFLGFLKGSPCQTTAEQVETLAPAAKAYGYLQTLIRPIEFNDFITRDEHSRWNQRHGVKLSTDHVEGIATTLNWLHLPFHLVQSRCTPLQLHLLPRQMEERGCYVMGHHSQE